MLDQFEGDTPASVGLVDNDVLQVSSTSIMSTHRTAYDSFTVYAQEAHTGITSQVSFCGQTRVSIADRNA